MWHLSGLSSPLNFRMVHHEPGVFSAVKYDDDVLLMFADSSHYSGNRAKGSSYDASMVGHGVEVRIMVHDVDAFYENVNRTGVPIILDIESRYYGLRDFIFEDVNGFHIRVASPSS